MKALVEGAPEGVRITVHVLAKPQTKEEFDAIIEAAGGAERFGPGYRGEDAIARLGDEEDSPYLSVSPPPGTGVKPPQGHPFIRDFFASSEAGR